MCPGRSHVSSEQQASQTNDLFCDDRGPIREWHGAPASYDGWNHMVEALVVLCRVIQLEVRSQAKVHFMERFDRAD
jgi:hypothetical protein